ncbi:LysM peptidoglycan-binding domain-containing protein [Streptomyces chartreusis]|uniref:LysM peptidoglycan-binding domain-containing protein n=1 Tax=Streptomyces chartreusis TaxID=1969 RepID=UPI00381E7CA8
MFLKTGRHRRPRQAPPFVAAAGVTSSAIAIAIPLLGASAANAADTPWDWVAECESGSAWSANLHYGYFGGLRISQTHWEKYGGLSYASRADEASRSQQIAVAERILASEGTTPWATCAPPSGLSKHSASVPVDTGVANDASSTRYLDRSSRSDFGLYGQGLSHPGVSGSAALPSPSVPSAPSTDPADAATASPGSSDSPDTSAGVSTTAPSPSLPTTHEGSVASDEPISPGTPAAPPEAAGSDSGQGEGARSLVDTGADLNGGSTGTGRHRGSSAKEVPTDTPASSGRHASRTDESTGTSHTVRAGDTLTSIASSLDVSGGWPDLYAENETVIGPNPDHIVPGQSVKTP